MKHQIIVKVVNTLSKELKASQAEKLIEALPEYRSADEARALTQRLHASKKMPE